MSFLTVVNCVSVLLTLVSSQMVCKNVLKSSKLQEIESSASHVTPRVSHPGSPPLSLVAMTPETLSFRRHIRALLTDFTTDVFLTPNSGTNSSELS